MCRYQDNSACGLFFSIGRDPHSWALLGELCSCALPSIKEPPNTGSLLPQAEEDKLSHLKDKMQNRNLYLAFQPTISSSSHSIRIRSPGPFSSYLFPNPLLIQIRKESTFAHGSLLVTTCSVQFSFLAAQQLKVFLCWENIKYYESWGREGKEKETDALSPYSNVEELAWDSDCEAGQLQGPPEPAEVASSI